MSHLVKLFRWPGLPSRASFYDGDEVEEQFMHDGNDGLLVGLPSCAEFVCMFLERPQGPASVPR